MSVELPSWQPFADDADVPIPNGPEPGRVVALLAPRYDTGESWAAGLAFDLATRWTGAGHRIVLADAALEHPTLHRHVGLPNEEGVTDASRFGASVARVARPVPGRSFFLITAGTPAGDGAGIAASARWGRLVAGFGEAGVTLVLFLREGGAGVETFLSSAADVVVLAAPGHAPPAVPDEGRARVRAVIGPDGGAAGSGVTADVAPARESVVVDPRPLDGSGEADRVMGGPGATGLPPADGADEAEGMSGYGAVRDPLDDLLGVGSGTVDDDAPRSDVAAAGSPVDAEPTSGYAAAGAGMGRRESSDPDARRKLLWVALVVLALVVVILVGVLRPG